MVRYLKERGTYVLFNTNGTLLTERKGRELVEAGLDELRVSLDAAEPVAFTASAGGATCSPASPAGSAVFARCSAPSAVVDAARFAVADRSQGDGSVSLPISCGLRTTWDVAREIPAAPRLFPQESKEWRGPIRRCSPATTMPRERRSVRPRRWRASLGIAFNASGATDPAASLKPGETAQPGRCAAARGR